MSKGNIKRNLAAFALTVGIPASMVNAAEKDEPHFDQYDVEAISEKCDQFQQVKIEDPVVAKQWKNASKLYNLSRSGRLSNYKIPTSIRNRLGLLHTLDSFDNVANYRAEKNNPSVFIGVIVKNRADDDRLVEQTKDMVQEVMAAHYRCGAFAHEVWAIAYDRSNHSKYKAADGAIVLKMGDGHYIIRSDIDSARKTLSAMFVEGEHVTPPSLRSDGRGYAHLDL